MNTKLIIWTFLHCSFLCSAMEKRFQKLSLEGPPVQILVKGKLPIEVKEEVACLTPFLNDIIKADIPRWDRKIQCLKCEHQGVYPIIQALNAMAKAIKNTEEKNPYRKFNAAEDLQKNDTLTVLRWYDIIKPCLEISLQTRNMLLHAAKVFQLPLIEQCIKINRLEAVGNLPFLMLKLPRDIWTHVMKYLREHEQMYRPINSVIMKNILMVYSKDDIRVDEKLICIASSADNNYIAAVTQSGAIRLFEREHPEKYRQYKNIYTGSLMLARAPIKNNSLKWLPNNTFVIKDGTGTEYLYDLKGNCSVMNTTPNNYLSPEQKSLIVSDNEADFVHEGKMVCVKHQSGIDSYCWSPDSRYLMTSSTDLLQITHKGGQQMDRILNSRAMLRPYLMHWSDNGQMLLLCIRRFEGGTIVEIHNSSLFQKVSDCLYAKLTFKEWLLLQSCYVTKQMQLNQKTQKTLDSFAQNASPEIADEIKKILKSYIPLPDNEKVDNGLKLKGKGLKLLDIVFSGPGL